MNEPSSKTSRWLHIPMEIIEREMFPKLFLADIAMQQGWQCIIGTKKTLINAANDLPPGIVYLKSVIPSELNNLRILKKAGHKLVSLDEEGLVQASLKTLVETRFNQQTIAETDKFFCWGNIQRDALHAEYPEDATKFVTTGSPTADLWSERGYRIHEKSIADIKSKHGKYILMPSSFGVPNHFMGPEEALRIMERDNMLRLPEDIKYYEDYYDFTSKVYGKFKRLLPAIAKNFPDHKIILRPHPSENHDTWRQSAQGMPNVEVLFEGTVSPWLLGADAIVHWGSTTGIEAYLSGKPVIGFCPYPELEKKFDVLPHLVSILCQDNDQVIAAINDTLDNPNNWRSHYADVLNGHEILKGWIANMDMEETAAETIIGMIDSMETPASAFDGTVRENLDDPSLKERVWRFLEIIFASDFIQENLPYRIKVGLKSRAYGRQKAKQLTNVDVQSAIDQIAPGNIGVKQLGKNLFWLQHN